jgi:hypothetical protein
MPTGRSRQPDERVSQFNSPPAASDAKLADMTTNPLFHRFLAAMFFTLAPQSATAQDAKPLPRIAAEDVSIHPFTANHRDKKIDPKTKGIFDEHRVSVTATKQQTRIRISGKMKNAGGSLEGQPVLHLGKLALIPVSERTGSIKVGAPSIVDVTRYIIALEVADDKLVTEFVELKKGPEYHWSVTKKDGEIVYTVMLDGEKQGSVSAPENQVRAFGIAAFTRFEDNPTDISFSID